MKFRNLAVGAAATLTLAGGIALAPAASAAPSPAPAHAAAATITYCPYQVNGTGVRVRTGPGTNYPAIKEISYPTKGLASQNLYSGSGLYWRKGFGGYVASQYLTRLSGPCAQ